MARMICAMSVASTSALRLVAIHLYSSFADPLTHGLILAGQGMSQSPNPINLPNAHAYGEWESALRRTKRHHLRRNSCEVEIKISIGRDRHDRLHVSDACIL